MTAIATSSLDGAGLARKGLARKGLGRKGLGRKGLDHCERITPFARSGLFAIGLATAGLVAAGFGLTPGPAAAGDTLQVTNARVPASDQVGIDLPLLMTIRNDGRGSNRSGSGKSISNGRTNLTTNKTGTEGILTG